MVPDYPELRQYPKKLSRKRLEFHKVTFLEIWNFNQKSTISNLNMSSKDGEYRHCHKRNNQKSILIKKENLESLILKK